MVRHKYGKTFGQICREKDPERFKRTEYQFQNYDREELLETILGHDISHEYQHKILYDVVDQLKKKPTDQNCKHLSKMPVGSGRDYWTTTDMCENCGAIFEEIEQEPMGK